jgi:predicted fused transcriptional regulator/phosphomethylpyrimidine kinase
MEQIIMQKSEKILRASLIPALGMNFVYRIETETDLNKKACTSNLHTRLNTHILEHTSHFHNIV